GRWTPSSGRTTRASPGRAGRRRSRAWRTRGVGTVRRGSGGTGTTGACWGTWRGTRCRGGGARTAAGRCTTRRRTWAACTRGKGIYVMVDPESVEWVFADHEGRQLRTQPAGELQAGRIRGLTVTDHR